MKKSTIGFLSHIHLDATLKFRPLQRLQPAPQNHTIKTLRTGTPRKNTHNEEEEMDI